MRFKNEFELTQKWFLWHKKVKGIFGYKKVNDKFIMQEVIKFIDENFTEKSKIEDMLKILTQKVDLITKRLK
jgi:hypothetical protein